VSAVKSRRRGTTESATGLLLIASRNFKLGYYDLPTVEWVESTKTPFTWQETLTQTFLNVNATEFAGPLLVSF